MMNPRVSFVNRSVSDSAQKTYQYRGIPGSHV